MKHYLILAAADISKSQASASISNSNTNSQHRNITIDSDEPSDTINTYNSNNGYGINNNNNNYYNNNTNFTRNGSIKFILKEIFPTESEELITAFEFDGRILKQPNIDPKTLVGKVLQVNTFSLDFSRGTLLLKCDECQIVGMHGQDISVGMAEDLFDEVELLDLSFI